MNMQTTARGRAVARQDEAIATNVAKIEEAKRSPSAIDKMAARLSISPGNLKTMLMNTVFKGASEAEFMALVIVSDAYGLNPMLKEIFAFPAKGGGIIPVVSVDGWVRIMNEHPQFDGIEFNDIVDENGTLYAIESVIYRRDRSRPIKVTEYMDECKGPGPAWQKTPKRMLRHRALIQGNRVAFGFSGIYAEGDEGEAVVIQDGGEMARPVPPSRNQVSSERYDPDTGEIDEASARDLDRQGFHQMEGRSDEQHGDQHDGADEDDGSKPWDNLVADITARIESAKIMGDLIAVDTILLKNGEFLPEEVYAALDEKVVGAKAAMKKGAAK
jgi:phage recombination protein Bet